VILREFRWNVLLRVLTITGLAIALAFVLISREWFFTPLVLSMLLVFATWNLIYYIERTNKDLTYFILSIKQGGFTTSFSDSKRGKTFKRLSQAFNDVIDEFQKINLQKETHYQYLQLLTDHISVGIISHDPLGKIQLMNPAAKQLLQVIRMNNIEEIKGVSKKLHQQIVELHASERQLTKMIIKGTEVHLSVQARELLMDGTAHRIILLQDLKSELEEKEVDAWQKLIRVLTHEIMNSVTPIVSLTEAVNNLLKSPAGERKTLDKLDAEDREDLYGSLKTIESRSKGLLRFVNAYKDYTKTPELRISKISVVDAINSVLQLLKSDFEMNHVEIDLKLNEKLLMAQADPEWLEQVLINVVKNALEAIGQNESGRISIRSSRGSGKLEITVADNGPGMDKEVLEKIFVPFFTTKKSGSGIGLSLSRQIMKLHRGDLTVNSEPGKGTTVVLTL
jgi:nitrogen fixation/metabolism regulation signal transduction histidine kinase